MSPSHHYLINTFPPNRFESRLDSRKTCVRIKDARYSDTKQSPALQAGGLLMTAYRWST